MCTRTCTGAHTHEFNVTKNEMPQAARQKTAAPAAKTAGKKSGSRGRRIQVRSSGVHGRGVYAVAPIEAGEVIIEYTGERISWDVAMDRHPHDPKQPNHTFYFHIETGEVIDALHGGNSSRWINHACDPNCEADEVDGRVFIKALRDLRGAGRGAVLRLRPGDRRTLYAEAEKRVCLLLRQPRLPWHHARAQTLRRNETR